MAKKAKLSKKESSVIAKLNKALKDSGSHFKKIELKPKETRQHLNDILKTSGFKDMELKSLKFGSRRRKCLEYQAVRDNEGNIIGWVCVKWGS
jgi:hypothetical protein